MNSGYFSYSAWGWLLIDYFFLNWLSWDTSAQFTSHIFVIFLWSCYLLSVYDTGQIIPFGQFMTAVEYFQINWFWFSSTKYTHLLPFIASDMLLVYYMFWSFSATKVWPGLVILLLCPFLIYFVCNYAPFSMLLHILILYSTLLFFYI